MTLGSKQVEVAGFFFFQGEEPQMLKKVKLKIRLDKLDYLYWMAISVLRSVLFYVTLFAFLKFVIVCIFIY